MVMNNSDLVNLVTLVVVKMVMKMTRVMIIRTMKLKKMSSKPRHAYCIAHLCGRESKKVQNKRKNRAVVGHREKVETKRGKRSTHKRRRGRGSTYRRRRGPTSK